MATTGHLLQETGDHLLQETGDLIILNNQPDDYANSILSWPIAYLHYDAGESFVDIFIADTSKEGVEGVTSPTIWLKKYGENDFAAVSDGNWTEIGFGWYVVRLDENDVDTLGALIIRVDDGTNPVALRFAEVGLDASDQHNMYLRVRGFFKERK